MATRDFIPKASKDLKDEYFNKILLGKGDLDATFNEYVQKWKKSGGEEIIVSQLGI